MTPVISLTRHCSAYYHQVLGGSHQVFKALLREEHQFLIVYHTWRGAKLLENAVCTGQSGDWGQEVLWKKAEGQVGWPCTIPWEKRKSLGFGEWHEVWGSKDIDCMCKWPECILSVPFKFWNSWGMIIWGDGWWVWRELLIIIPMKILWRLERQKLGTQEANCFCFCGEFSFLRISPINTCILFLGEFVELYRHCLIGWFTTCVREICHQAGILSQIL